MKKYRKQMLGGKFLLIGCEKGSVQFAKHFDVSYCGERATNADFIKLVGPFPHVRQ